MYLKSSATFAFHVETHLIKYIFLKVHCLIFTETLKVLILILNELLYNIQGTVGLNSEVIT